MEKEIKRMRPFLVFVMLVIIIIFYVAVIRIPLIEYYRYKVFWAMIFGLGVLILVLLLAFFIGFSRSSKKTEGVLLYWLAQNLQIKFETRDTLEIMPLLIEGRDAEYYGSRITVKGLKNKVLEVDVNFGIPFADPSDITEANLARKILSGEIATKAADICINKR